MSDTLHALFEANLPESLYLDHYTLAKEYGHTPKEWREYLRNPDTKRFIDSELAAITEASARSALNKLGSGLATSSDVTAIKQLLEKSQLLQQNQNQKENIIITYMPKKEYETLTQKQLDEKRKKEEDPTHDPTYVTPEEELEAFLASQGGK